MKWLSSYHGILNFQKEHFTFYETSENVLYEQKHWRLPT